jgi:uncharacterized FAD-dependent dehydrogenase
MQDFSQRNFVGWEILCNFKFQNYKRNHYMTEDYQIRIDPRTASDESRIIAVISEKYRLNKSRFKKIQIVKRSIDARQRNVMINLTVRCYLDEMPESTRLYEPYVYGDVSAASDVIVVGAGPGGLFAALRLIELGYRPVVLERGKNVDERRLDLAQISRKGIVDENSNYSFGEGGAGAYSDGKLYTRSKKRGSVNRILQIFNQFGVSDNILIDAHPHIGSDKLPGVIRNMRNEIIRCGGEVHFSTLVTDLRIVDNKVVGVVCADEKEFDGPVILATGHSARDVYRMLKQKGVKIEPKGIAVGVRLEHPQHLIDCIQYHSKNGRGDYLPAAEYSFVTQVEERGVYSFCMCPGGIVVPASSGPEQLVVNGMSPSNRGSRWANSGMVVEVRPEDLPQEYDKAEELKVMAFQEDLEKKCYIESGRTLNAGAQRMLDFVEGRDSVDLPRTSYAPGIHPSRLDLWLPSFIGRRLQQGFRKFGSFARGFLTNEAILIGVESRTSSPVRIPRDLETMAHVEIAGLYPCGEGAGYAGGIVSAAMDGEKCAEAVADYLRV